MYEQKRKRLIEFYWLLQIQINDRVRRDNRKETRCLLLSCDNFHKCDRTSQDTQDTWEFMAHTTLDA